MIKTFAVGPRPLHQRPAVQLGATLLLGLAIMTDAAAWGPQPERPSNIQVRPTTTQTPVTLHGIGQVESLAGETQEDFIRRVGRVLHDFTTATGYEGCGAFGERLDRPTDAAGRYVVPLVTNGSHVACTPAPSWLSDATFSGESIHSHPMGHRFTFTATESDRVFLSDIHRRRTAVGREVRFTKAGPGEMPFSRSDFASGPGWLVNEGEIHYQNGPTQVRYVGSIASSQGELHPIPPSNNRWITYWDDQHIQSFHQVASAVTEEMNQDISQQLVAQEITVPVLAPGQVTLHRENNQAITTQAVVPQPK